MTGFYMMETLVVKRLSNFTFNCKNYLQLRGCATGEVCAPSYANIFMAGFEKKHIYPFINPFMHNVVKWPNIL